MHFSHETSAWMVGSPMKFMLVTETNCDVLYIQTILLWSVVTGDRNLDEQHRIS